MNLKVIFFLSTFVSVTSFARVSQYCESQDKTVTYSDGCGMEEKPCFMKITVGGEEKSLATYTGDKINLYPASESEVVIGESIKEEKLVILQRNGTEGTLTYFIDQNKMLSNLSVKCSDNDDK